MHFFIDALNFIPHRACGVEKVTFWYEKENLNVVGKGDFGEKCWFQREDDVISY